MRRYFAILTAFSICFFYVATLEAAPLTLHLGILAQRPKLQMQQAWQPFADYLSKQLPGYRVQLHLLDHQELLAALQQQQLDFVLTNPSHYVVLRQKTGLSGSLATLVPREGPKPLSSFGGVIFTRSSRNDIKTFSDLKGKRIACIGTGPGTFGGFQMQLMELHRAGITLKPQQLLSTGMPQDLVIKAVLEGKADVGFVRTGLLEQLERLDRIPVGSLTVIHRQNFPDFPFASSTRLYPEWPFVALPHVDQRLAARVAATLLQLEPGSPALEAAGIHSFSIPADYLPVEELLQELRLPPFDTAPPFNIRDVWKRYWPWMISLALAIAIGIQRHLHQITDKRRLKAALRELEQQQSHLRTAHEEAESANRSMRLLSASNQTLLRSIDEEEQLSQVCRIAVEIGGYSTAWVGLALHDEDKTITPLAWFGIEEEKLAQAQMSWADNERGASAMGTAIRTNSIQIRQDILHDPSLAPWHDSARKRNHQSAIALPLSVQGEVIGALAIYAAEPHAFQKDEVELLNELTSDLAFGIQTVRLRRAHEKAQAHVQQLAYYDRLTGLPNQFKFMEELDRSVAAAAVESQTFSLLLLDLNHLHEINETYGHTLGDQVLVRVAQQLLEVCGQDYFVARFGGDFAIICPGIDQTTSATLGEKILAVITTPFHLSGHCLTISGNIGMVLYPEDGKGASELLSKVDLATSRVKAAGGGFCFYRPEMGEHLARTLKVARRLEHSIQENMLQLFYQPKVDLLTGQMNGAEALLRWHDSVLGWVSPAEFVPIAEDRGMMVELGSWVLRTACYQIRQWQDKEDFHPGKIAVNVSARQLEAPDFLSRLIGIIEETGVSPDCLELELTESLLMTDPERIIGTLNKLKDRGFSLAIDDFGTGYSSLAYLKRFPVDTLKIDRAFVRDMLEDQNDRAIVATVVAMAQQLGLTTVAEGIEEEGQRKVLLQLGCLQGQGFHFCRPKPPEQFKEKWRIDNCRV